jgi:tight adherence protein C
MVFAYQGIISPLVAIIVGASIGGIGILAPSFWLDYLKSRRQTMMRRALPDALDTVVVCLEGGLSLSSAFSRVSTELSCVHPTLALELKIVEREVRMGRTTGEAIRSLAQRFDLEELRSMASVIIHSERYGASVSNALNVFAESLRVRRQQRAEELAHKSAIKIIFPTVFCILPAMFVVILGPAVMRVMETLLPTLYS